MYTSKFFVHLCHLVESNKKVRLAENYLAISNVIFAVYIILGLKYAYSILNQALSSHVLVRRPFLFLGLLNSRWSCIVVI
jgi:hypothetical protein